MWKMMMDLVFNPVFTEGESTAARLRKIIVLLIGMANGGPACAVGGYWMYVASKGDPDSDGAMFFVVGLYLFLFGIFTTVAFAVVRYTKELHKWLFDVFVLAFELLGVVFFFGLPSTQAVLLLCGCLQVVHISAETTFGFFRVGLLFILSVLQSAALTFPLSFNYGAKRQNLGSLEYFIYIMCALVICQPSITVGSVYFLVRVNNAQRAKAEGAVALAHRIVDLLRDYDTDGVTEELLEEESKGEVDPKLIASLRAMNRNLEEYRPHLPNYLFLKSTTTDDEAENMKVESVGKAEKKYRKTSAAVDVESEGTLSDSDRASSSRVSSVERTSNSAKGSNVMKRDGSLHRTATGDKMTFEGNVAVALIDCRACFADGETAAASNIVAFVNAIYTVAKTTHASIHNLAGDTAMLSWNATHRISRPQAHAALFLAKLKAATAALPGFRLCAAATVHRAVCHHVVSSTKQQALLIEQADSAALYTCFELAKAYSTVLVSEGIQSASQYEVESQPVELLSYERGKPNSGSLVLEDLHVSLKSASDAKSTFTVYEVLKLHQHEENEWMYQVAATEEENTSISNKVTKAFMLAKEKEDVGGALDILCHLPTEGNVKVTPLVQRLQNALEKRLRPNK